MSSAHEAPLHARSLTDVAASLARGEITAAALTESMLQRQGALERRTRAFQCVLDDAARADADRLDAQLAAGATPGLLHGVPIAVKDLLDMQGLPTLAGTRVRAGHRAAEDAPVIARLRAAGAVILGKLKLTEGAFSDHHPEVQPPLNPHDAEAWTGVSSSGSGVATAAGLCFASLGSDTGGSIRFPCTACGLVGVKPTYGRVSRRGVFPLAMSLDHVGPMARSVADAARMLSVIAGHDPDEATSLALPGEAYHEHLDQLPKGLRVGVDASLSTAGVDAEVVAATEQVRAGLEAQGARTRALQLPDARPLIEGWALTCGVEAAIAHASTFPRARDRYGPALAALLDLGHRATAVRYAELEECRRAYRAAWRGLFADVDAILLPTLPGRVPDRDDAGRGAGDQPPMITFTAPSDYAGCPSVTVPVALDTVGRPLAAQLLGPDLSEHRLLQLAAAWERARGPWAGPALLQATGA